MRYIFPNSKIASSIAKTISYVTEYPLTLCQKEVALLTGYRTWKELNVFHSPKNHYISYEMIKANLDKTDLIKKIIDYRGIYYLLNILNLKYKKNFTHSEVLLEDRTKIILDDIPNMDKGIFIFENFDFNEFVLSEVELLILEIIQKALNNKAVGLCFSKEKIIFRLENAEGETQDFNEDKFLLLKNYLKKYANFDNNLERVFSGKLNMNWLPECIDNIRFVYDRNALSFTKEEELSTIVFKFLMKKNHFYHSDDVEKNKVKINSFFHKFIQINKNIKKIDDNFDLFLKEINCKNKSIIDLKNHITVEQHHTLSKISEEYDIPIYIFKNNLYDTKNKIPRYCNCLKIYMNEFKKYDYSLDTSSVQNQNEDISMLCPKNLRILEKINKDEILNYDGKVLFFYNYYSEISSDFLNQNKNIYSVGYNNNIFERTVRNFLRSRADIIFINNIQISEIRIFIYLVAIGYQLKGYYNPGPYLTKDMIDKKIQKFLK